MNRRDFLGTAALAVAGTTARARDDEHRFVTSDVGRLRRVLIHEPGPECRKALDVLDNDHSLRANDLMNGDAVAQHRAFVAEIKASDAEVLDTRDLLEGAIDEARRAGQFENWLTANVPKLIDRAATVDADDLLGGSDDLIYPTNGGGKHGRPLVIPLKYHFYVRDVAVMTPRGLVLTNLDIITRRFENVLFQFLQTWSPALRRYPVVYDARVDRMPLQGGDLIVADESTLLLGVGNLTDERAARALAAELEMDVIAVQLPGLPSRRRRRPPPLMFGLRTKFLHLDSVFNLVAPKTALAVPYFLEAHPELLNPLSDLIQALADEHGGDDDAVRELTEAISEIGLIRRYKAGSGQIDSSLGHVKLLDYLRARSYTVLPVGGSGQGIDPVKHVVEDVFHELRFQAANVVALGPNHVIANTGNTRTLDVLRDAKVDVVMVGLNELTRWQGGPHCLTLPLERD